MLQNILTFIGILIQIASLIIQIIEESNKS